MGICIAMVRPTDKWTKGDVIHYFWITGALLSVIIFLNTTHVIISRNSDFCEVEEDVDDFLKRNNVLFGLPESTLGFEEGETSETSEDEDEVPTRTSIGGTDGENVENPKNANETLNISPDEELKGNETADEPGIELKTTVGHVITTKSTSTTSIRKAAKIMFMDKLAAGNGRWRQVKTVGLDEFLKAEGGSWIYRSLAGSATPDFIYVKKGPNHYEQRVEVSVFPSQVNQIYFGIEYSFKDQFGDTVTCIGNDYGDHIESVTTGGRGGKMRTFMQLVNNQLFLTTILEDKNNAKAVRIFEKR